ncbi:hypothetical protein IFM89_037742 [Coptis chinensis]|uniref:Uncharacterized protein n=1 Tax=Coptis chinensis TaxID=261450 RepID=A0A835IS73_9MAGN|nr:hypothetical protein IFM89_037742 [Coptis chinensis]
MAKQSVCFNTVSSKHANLSLTNSTPESKWIDTRKKKYKIEKAKIASVKVLVSGSFSIGLIDLLVQMPKSMLGLPTTLIIWRFQVPQQISLTKSGRGSATPTKNKQFQISGSTGLKFIIRGATFTRFYG